MLKHEAWNAADAEKRFTELLDRAEHEGPQVVQFEDKQFIVTLKDEEGNRLVRAFLDEPEFRNINIDRIDAPVKAPEL
ncbi:MAG TPA: hypothetical protein VNZ58_08000 [Thermomicrobiales bacterium]|nr:hypothetical protein [Thermomicrobiales bacterium]